MKLTQLELQSKPSSPKATTNKANWQESSLKKLQPKKVPSGWAQVKSTKIEEPDRDFCSSMRSSQLKALKSVPPQEKSIESGAALEGENKATTEDSGF